MTNNPFKPKPVAGVYVFPNYIGQTGNLYQRYSKEKLKELVAFIPVENKRERLALERKMIAERAKEGNCSNTYHTDKWIIRKRRSWWE